MGKLDQAMELLKEEEALCRETGNEEDLQACLGNQALIHQSQGAIEKALELYREKEAICRACGSIDGLIIALTNQATLLVEDRNKYNEVEALAEEAFKLANDHGLDPLAGQIKPLLEFVKSKTRR